MPFLTRKKELMNEKRTYEVSLDDRMFSLEIEVDKLTEENRHLAVRLNIVPKTYSKTEK